MGITKYLIILLGMASASLSADPGCLECSVAKSKTLEGHPSSKAISDLVASTAKPVNALKKKQTSSKESYQDGFCDKYEMAQDTVDVETIIEEMEACPYASSLNEFWTTPACHAPLKIDTKVPIIFNTASNAPKSENFPKIVHDYFVEEKNNPQMWLKIINTKTSDGLTFLDFLQYNLQRGYYDSVTASKDAALRIVNYICKNGGIYSKYKNTAKCPH